MANFDFYTDKKAGIKPGTTPKKKKKKEQGLAAESRPTQSKSQIAEKQSEINKKNQQVVKKVKQTATNAANTVSNVAKSVNHVAEQSQKNNEKQNRLNGTATNNVSEQDRIKKQNEINKKNQSLINKVPDGTHADRSIKGEYERYQNKKTEAEKNAEEVRKTTEARINQYNNKATEEDRKTLAKTEVGKIGELTRGAVEQQAGGLLKGVGDSSNEAEQQLDLYKHKYEMGDIDEKRYNELVEAYNKTGKGKWNKEAKETDIRKKLDKGYENIYKAGDELTKKGSERIATAKEGMSQLGKWASDAYVSGAQMAMDQATGGAWWASMLTRSMGSSRGDAESMGGSRLQDMRNASIQGLLETGSEFMFSGVGLAKRAVGGKALFNPADKVAAAAVAKMNSGFKKNLLYGIIKGFGGIAEENAEEIANWIASTPMQNLAYGNELQDRLESESRSSIEGYSSTLMSQLEQASQATGIPMDQMIDSAIINLNDEDNLKEQMQELIDNGAPKKQAKKLAEMYRDYAVASLTGDEDEINKMEDKLLRELTTSNGQSMYKQKYSGQELVDTIMSTTIMTGVTGAGQMVGMSMSGKQMRENGEILSKTLGVDGVKSLVDKAAQSEDHKIAAKAKAMQKYVTDGHELANIQVAELANDYMQDVQANQKRLAAAQEVAQRKIAEKGYTASLADNETVGLKTDEAKVAMYRQLGEKIDGDKLATIADAFAQIQVGNVDNIDTITAFDAEDTEARKAYEAITGEELPVVKTGNKIDIPATNAATRDYLAQKSAANLVSTAEEETINWNDRTKGKGDAAVLNNVGNSGQVAYRAQMESMKDTNASDYQTAQYAFKEAYKAGKYGKSFESIKAAPIVNKADANLVTEAYRAGVKDSAYGDETHTSNTGTLTVDTKEHKVTSSQIATFTDIANVMNVNIRLVDEAETTDVDGNRYTSNGYYDPKTNTIVLGMNVNESIGIAYTIMHEFTHSLQQNAENDYNAYRDFVKQAYIDRYGEDGYQQRIDAYRKAYDEVVDESFDENYFLDELVCDYSREFLNDKAFVDNICEDNPGLARSIVQAIKNIMRRIRLMLSTGGLGKYENSLLKELDGMKEAERLWMEAVKAANARQADVATAEQRSSLSIEKANDVLYMKAVENNDIDKLQTMVDEAAKKAGFDSSEKVYHGAHNEFTVFERGVAGIYMATNRKVAEEFGDMSNVKSLYVKFENPFETDALITYPPTENYPFESYKTPYYFEVPTPQEMIDDGFKDGPISTEEIAHWAEGRGYDGVIIRNVKEGSGRVAADDYIAFTPNAIKSADPITYDDNGNIIPLSERFNSEKDDIRWSMSVTPEPENQHRESLAQEATEYYNKPYTEDWRESGYIFPDGKLPTMGAMGERYEDHYMVESAYDGDRYEDGHIIDKFVNEGNVRYMPESGAIQMGLTELTPEQLSVIRDIVVGSDTVNIEFVDSEGNVKDHKNYGQGARPDAVVNDIRRFYKDGKIGGSQLSQFRFSRQLEEAEANDAYVKEQMSPAVRFSMRTYLDAQAKPKGFTMSKGWRGVGEDASGRQLLLQFLSGDNETDIVAERTVGLLDKMTNWFDSGALQVKYQYINWDNLTDASVKVRRDSSGNIVSVVGSAMVANGEYPVNFDLTTICNKREGMMDVIKSLATITTENGSTLLDNIELSRDDMFKINRALKNEGVETACLGCFVESRRYNTQNFISKVDEKWNASVRERRKELGLPEEEYFDFAGDKKPTDEDVEASMRLWDDYESTKGGKKSPQQRINTLLANADASSPYLKLIRASDILTPQGIEKLKTISTEGHDLVKFIKSIYGTAAPKEILDFTPYNSEIILLPKKKGTSTPMEEYLKEIGGIRFQSFSDFKVENVFDYMQMIADASARKFPGHSYTKVIDFARIFGNTGLKINLSVMFDVMSADEWSQITGTDRAKGFDLAKKYAGCTFVDSVPEGADGRPYVFYEDFEGTGKSGYLTYLVGDKDRAQKAYEELKSLALSYGNSEDEAELAARSAMPFEQSISYKDASDLQNKDGYRENVGVIAVGYSDEHIRLLLKDSNVRYVIPYHKSGLPTEISKLTNLGMASSYERSQNTTKVKRGYFVDKEGSNVTMKSLYNKFNESHPDGKYNATQFYVDTILSGEYTPLLKEPSTTKDGEIKETAAEVKLHGTGEFDVYESLDRHVAEKHDGLDAVVNEYCEYCIENNCLPVFWDFLNEKDYFKFLFDYSVADADYNIYPQQNIQNKYFGVNYDEIAQEREIDDSDLEELKNGIMKAAESQNAKDEVRVKAVPKVVEEITTKGNINSVVEGTNINFVRGDTEDINNPKMDNSESIRYSRDIADSDIRYSQPASEDSLMDWMMENIDDIETLPASDPVVEEGRQRMAKSKAEFIATKNTTWNERWLTEGKILDTKKAEKDIRNLIKGVMENADTDKQYRQAAVENAMVAAKRMFWAMKNGNHSEAADLAWETARDMILDENDNSKLYFINDEMFKQYEDLRDYLRTVSIKVDDAYKSDIDYSAYRKRNLGRLKIKNNGLAVDEIWGELNEMFPEFFSMEVEHPADMLLEIEDVLDKLQPIREAYDSEEARYLAEELANDLYAIVYEGKDYKSIADTYKNKYDKKVASYRERLKEAQREVNRQKKISKQEFRQWKKAEQEKQKSKKAHMDSFGSIKKNYEWLTDRLLKETKDKNIPEVFRRELAHTLQLFDLQSERSKNLEAKYGPAQKTIQMGKLRDALGEIAKEDDSGEMTYNGYAFMLMDALAKKIDGQTIDALDNTDLAAVDQLLKAIKHDISRFNKVRIEGKEIELSEVADRAAEAAQAKIKQKARRDRPGQDAISNAIDKLDFLLNEAEETPIYFFERIGGGINEMYQELRRGEDQHIRNINYVRKSLEDILNKYYKKHRPGSKLEKFQKDSNTFTTEGGDTIVLTTSQIMSLYCLSKREQALSHILGAGIIPSSVKAKRKPLAAIKGEESAVVPTLVTYNDVMRIVKSLPDDLRTVADQLQSFMSNEMADLGNKTSMELYGIKQFREKNYFPIKSANEALNKSADKNMQTATNKIKNFGMTKALVKNANNSIYIDDIFEVVADHCNQMSLYNSMAVPLTDFMKVYNTKWTNGETGEVKTVQQYIAQAWTKKANTYIENFIDDVNGNTQSRSNGLDRMIKGALANYKKAAIGANMRVALQQPTAIFRALQVLGPQYLIRPAAPTKANLQEMYEHCPIALWKSWGNYEMDMGRDMADIMLNKDWSRWDTLTMGIYGSLDNMTWSWIFQSVKKEVSKKNPNLEYGSQEYWEAVNKRASEVFDKTQVVDSVFHRADTMRSKDGLVKMLTSFMAEPTLTYNVARSSLIEATEDLKAGHPGKALGIITRTIMVLSLNAAACSAAAAVADAVRRKGADDDDEEALRWSKLWMTNFVENFKDNAMIFPNNVFFFKDLKNVADGWDTKIMALEGWATLIKGTNSLAEYVQKQMDGEENKKSLGSCLKDVIAGLGYVTGVPTKTIIRDFDAVKAWGILPSFAADGSLEKVEVANETDKQKSEDSWWGKLISKLGLRFGEKGEETLEDYNKRIAKEGERLAARVKGESNKDEALWDSGLMDGYSQLFGIERVNRREKFTGKVDYQAIGEKRDIWIAAGGDPDYFDAMIASKAKSVFKKAIGTDAQYGMVDMMRDYGVSDEDISAIARTSDVAKDLKVAMRLDDEKAMEEELTTLIGAGLTEEDYEYLWKNRNRMKLSTYTGKYKDRLHSTGTYVMPVEGATSGNITSHFGYRNAPTAGASSNHQAIDIGMPAGTTVKASDGGTVVYAGYAGGYGKQVVIQHDDGTKTYYSHMSSWDVNKGDVVGQGQAVGKVGSTGTSTGPHLDFKVQSKSGTWLDPEKYIKTR